MQIENQNNGQTQEDNLPTPSMPNSNGTASTQEANKEINVKQQGFDFASFLPLIIVFAVFYFFMIRPQSKKQKEHVDMISKIKRGDKVMLHAGIIGIIIKSEMTDKEYVLVEISPGNVVQILRSAIVKILDSKFTLSNFAFNNNHKMNKNKNGQQKQIQNNKDSIEEVEQTKEVEEANSEKAEEKATKPFEKKKHKEKKSGNVE